MDNEFKELQTLLRLKKYEQPPQGFKSYSERFLKEFHRRQRWEESQNTGLAALWEKTTDWLDNFTVSRYAYATALVIFGVVAFGINGFQSVQSVTGIAVVSPSTPSAHTSPRPALALNSPLDLSDLEIQSQLNIGSQIANTANVDVQPRYILDTRPASYDASFSF